MTMVITAISGNSVIITADKRITKSNGFGQSAVEVVSDDYKKIKIIKGKYIVSFTGRTDIAKKAFEFIDDKIDVIKNYIDPIIFFKEAFKNGKTFFETNYPGIPPISVFFLGYINENKPKLYSFSSDDDYIGVEREAVIKMHSNNPEQEDLLTDETASFIGSKIAKQPLYYQFPQNLPKLYSEAIKRVDNIMIGNTTYSVLLTSSEIKEYEY
ncbi:hypothetical protein P8917_09225 [Bacillus atrophaeus]|uniref:hypothetical protein n=2 Tax=Bacillus atrophaeus TaxID=1452 RepID=UPI00228195E3|nr:hypothetical protein [Bacillus atrophaeus]MCY8499823.1 hypothetical protein [Bacillus atrophaeus]MCY8815021.1 hypothetical protein [Bacillus atrophaeus]MCY8823071.1 hypothetical protein [Bacillus atrophaeus]MCY8831296.1 hypothetical protein [Bacillus atrophaeus]MCY8834902.1 hypothetical protein [Bacillus atrophaeus]